MNKEGFVQYTLFLRESKYFSERRSSHAMHIFEESVKEKSQKKEKSIVHILDASGVLEFVY